MNKWLVLILLVILNLKSFSQKDTTQISLNNQTAKLVVKDLIKGDGAIAEIHELTKVVSLKDEQIGLYKQKDSLKEQKIGNLELIITKKDEQFGLERQKSESLFKELKGQRRKTFLYKVGSFVGIIMTSLYLLK